MYPTNVLIEKIKALRAWSRGDQRAVHKPLLVLYAVGQVGRGSPRLIPFKQIDRDLTSLLKEFGPARRTIHTEYPFWRLQNDGVWEVMSAKPLIPRQSNSDPLKSELISGSASGGFLPELYSLLKRNTSTRQKIIKGLLEAHFPHTLHDDILAAVGLAGAVENYATEQRSPEFRKDVLRIYNYRCCVCGYDLRLGAQFIGLEAAHIKWLQAGGPDEVRNGLALCILHHKLFDIGVFTIDAKQRLILCSQELNGSSRSDWMIGLHGQPVAGPQHEAYLPSAEYLVWHHSQVCRAPVRQIV